jgi:hypothetical protein
MVVNAALYPPACPTRIRKSRLVNPIESTFFLNVDKTAQGNKFPLRQGEGKVRT